MFPFFLQITIIIIKYIYIYIHFGPRKNTNINQETIFKTSNKTWEPMPGSPHRIHIHRKFQKLIHKIVRDRT